MGLIHGRSPKAQAIAKALGITNENCMGFDLHVFPNDVVTVTAEFAVRDSEAQQLVGVIEKYQLKTEREESCEQP